MIIFIFFSAFTELEVGKVNNHYLEKSININSLGIIKIINFLLENIKDNTISLNFMSTIALSYPKKKNYLYASSKLMVEHYLKSLMHFFFIFKTIY